MHGITYYLRQEQSRVTRVVNSYLSDLCVDTAAVVGRSGLRSTARGDLVVPRHRTEWGSRSFAVAGPKCWNKLPGWTQRFVGWS